MVLEKADRTPAEQLALIRAHTVDILPEAELLRKLASGRPLRVKLGVDASGPDIHLGHAVVLRKLRLFQDLGHVAVLIIGDFTGMIGDPSGRSNSRPQLTREQVERNVANYRQQVFKILDPGKTEFHFNREWLGKLTAEQLFRLASTHTVAQLLAREDFAKRYQSRQPISLHEFLYPIFQGYDSIAVRADIEIGGTDQKFNFLVARELQRENPIGPPQEPQCIVTFNLLVGTDGVEKMGKSLNNYIGIIEPPDQMFGKLMSIPDDVIEPYLALCTNVPEAEIAQMVATMKSGALNPRDAKRRLGREVVSLYHSPEAAREADERFTRVFSAARAQTKEDYAALAEELAIPDDLKGKSVWASTAIHRLGLVKTRSEAARLVKAGAVHLDEHQVADPREEVALAAGMLVRVGKRRLARLV